MATKRLAYTAEFELRAVKMITEQKLSVAEVGRRLGVTQNRVHDGKKAVANTGVDAFPGSGHLTPLDAENRQLLRRRQAARPGARHPRTSRGVRRQPDEVTFAWIGGRKGEWSITLVCRVREVSRPGFYAWRSRGASGVRS